MTEAFIGVGSNIRPEEHIPSALQKLQGLTGIKAISSFYRSVPLIAPHTPAPSHSGYAPFFNGMLCIEAHAAPADLHALLRQIEEELGRVRSADKYAPRPIDLDLVLFGALVLDTPGLRLPDPDLSTRNFLAVPLLELAPELVLPGSTQRLADLPIVRNRQGLEALPEFTALLRARFSRHR